MLRAGGIFLLLLTGFVLGLFASHVGGLKIEPKLDFGNLLSALVTLVLAFVISKWWRGEHYRSDTAKTILTEYLRALRSTQSEIRTNFLSLIAGEWDDKRYTEILRAFRSASNTVLEIETTARAVFDQDPCPMLRQRLRVLKAAVTSLTPSRHAALTQLEDIETEFSKFQNCIAETHAEILGL